MSVKASLASMKRASGVSTATPTADDPIYYALSGNLDEPAIPGFHPGLSSDVLYVTNGETTDYAHAETGALAWTPELSEGCPGCGFVFPDDDALVQAEFERNLIVERTKAGIAAAKRRNVHCGRPRIRLDDDHLRELRANGIPIVKIAEMLNVGASTVQRRLVAAGREVTT